ncbi:MAG: right-handed parallel beta-helix repeat-containing protein, partial [Planctomycetes bacterium]|nr:right-handed parallel beta-helix repeat-containing protein [Planctomycetota bacterium]
GARPVVMLNYQPTYGSAWTLPGACFGKAVWTDFRGDMTSKMDWTWELIEDIKFGVSVRDGILNGALCSEVYLEVEWRPNLCDNPNAGLIQIPPPTYTPVTNTLNIYPTADVMTNIANPASGTHWNLLADNNDATRIYTNPQNYWGAGKWSFDVFDHDFDESWYPDGKIISVKVVARAGMNWGGYWGARPLIMQNYQPTYGSTWNVRPACFPGAPFYHDYEGDMTDKKDWTWQDIADTQFGISMQDGFFNAAICTRIWLEVTWQPTGVPIIPIITTGNASAIDFETTTLNGTIKSLGDNSQVDVSFQWGMDSTYGQTASAGVMGANGSFSAGLSGLTPGETYYFRAKMTGAQTTYGSEKSFTTLGPPAVTTNDASDIQTDSAVLNGTLDSLGTATKATISFLWGTTADCADGETAGSNRTAPGAFTATLDGLTPDITYYFKAKATGDGMDEGDVFNFTTTHTPITFYVDIDATGGTNDGLSWTNAFTDLQSALNVAVATDTILIAKGTYTPDTTGLGDPREASFGMINDVGIYGGYAGFGEPDPNLRDTSVYETVLSGDIGVPGDTSDNAYHIFYHPSGTNLDSTAILDGFTITDGNANGSSPHNTGGGMVNTESSPTITTCTFTGNSAEYGGGMFNGDSSSPILTNCVFSGNIATINGGGMVNNASSPTMTNCTFFENHANALGGGMRNYASAPAVTNCTFYGNSAADGGAILNGASSYPTITNCILYGDTGTGPEIYNFNNSTPAVTYSNVQGGHTGTGNIDADPLFIDSSTGDFHLQSISPCIDLGDNAAPDLPITDFEGDPRIMGLSVDMGVDETPYQLPILTTFPATDVTPVSAILNGMLDHLGSAINVDVSFEYGTQPGVYSDETVPQILSSAISFDDSISNLLLDTTYYFRAKAVGEGIVYGEELSFTTDDSYGTIYVDIDATAGSNNGLSWTDAFTDLQSALGVAISGDEIWVAEGAYKPTTGTDRNISFQMINGVAIYGGFTGSETTAVERDWANNVTILSGDIGTTSDNSDNSYHVFYHPIGTNLDSTAILDGFTITGGNTDGKSTSPFGGGMYNYSSSPTLTNCTFSENSANVGGGMINSSSSPEMANCIFSANTAQYGGGMYNEISSPAVTNCAFSGNTSILFGGGMFNEASSFTMTNCTFSDNEASDGGGMYNNSFSSPEVINCTFSDNEATTNGGGIANFSSSPTVTNCIFSGNTATNLGGGMINTASSPEVTDCTFSGNTATTNGGGIYNGESSSPTLANCTFSQNTATTNGGGMVNNGSSPTITNCIFFGNHANALGGGIRNYASSPTVTNCTFYGNTAATGGAILNGASSTPTVTNCILYGDTGTEIYNFSSTPTVTYCDIQGGYTGTGNIDADPLFVDPSNGDFHLQVSSPGIDSGDNLAPGLPTNDFEGDARIMGLNVDMGVDETPYQLPIVTTAPTTDVTTNSATLNGTLDDLGSATNVTVSFLWGATEDCSDGEIGVDIMSTTGTFDAILGTLDSDTTYYYKAKATGDGTVYGDEFSFTTIREPGTLYVDIDATGGSSDGSSWTNAFTDLQSALDFTIPGDQIWIAKGIYKPSVEVEGTGNRYKSFQLINNVAIYGGFDPAVGDDEWEERNRQKNETILSGDIDNDGTLNNNSYHVFYHPGTNLDSTALLDGFTITGGNANGGSDHNHGGGMANFSSSPTVINCTFSGNQATWQGGGMVNKDNSNPTVTTCMFTQNQASFGGGMRNHLSAPTVTDCYFFQNTANDYGGGMSNNVSNPIIVGCYFIENTAINDGGGIHNYNASPEVTDCIFDENSGAQGGGIFNTQNSSPIVTESFFQRNQATAYHGGGMFNESSSPTVTHCSFAQNQAVYQGGGMVNRFGSNPNIANCSFTRNEASFGGGMRNHESSPIVADCTFSENTASDYGGGMSNNISHPTLTDSTFYLNTAVNQGGGMINKSSSPDVIGCSFSRNSADYGGGVLNEENSSPAISNCSFSGNTATTNGGGMVNNGSSPTISNCSFSGNHAIGGLGGGIRNYTSSPTITNCTFFGNSAANGGAILNGATSAPTVTNCILWGNTAPEIYNFSSTPTVNYCDVQGGYGGTGNIDIDPLFVDTDGPDNILGTQDDDLHLQASSPCIDSGDNSAPSLPANDFEGDDRIINSTVDMGVDEHEYFDCNGVSGGTAYIDNCGLCVGGSTGQTACVQDCNNEWGGSAVSDNCGLCVGGSTGQTACVQDCNNEWGGSAISDNCGLCVGGSTGQTACVQDCNNEWGGSAISDNCGLCVGGSTGQTACVQDCNNEWGGSAVSDNCGLCVGGSTGQTACVQDCNNEWGGLAYVDDCGFCVGGNTGNTACEL